VTVALNEQVTPVSRRMRPAVARIWICAAFVSGGLLATLLRLLWVDEQLILDDEYHAILVALNASYGHIASHFHPADNCIPLTLVYKLIMDTWGLSELTLRAPQLLFGLLLVFLSPLALRGMLSPAERGFLLFSLAISPMLVFYSRFGRPYVISTALATFAVVAVIRGQRDPRPRWLGLYVPCAFGAAYFHLLALPYVVAPVLFYGAVSIFRAPEHRRRVRRLFMAAILFLAILGAAIGPAIWISHSELFRKLSGPEFSFLTFSRAAHLLTGLSNGWAVLAVLAVAGYGAVVFLRREAEAGSCLLFSAAVQIVTVLLLAPAASHHSDVYARYHLWLFPVFLLFLSVGAVSMGRGRWRAGAVIAVAATLVWFSPLPSTYSLPNNFTNHRRYRADYFYGSHWPHITLAIQQKASFFYHLLAKEERTCSVVETPWYPLSYAMPLPDYQRLHRKPVVAGVLDPSACGWLPVADDRRLRFHQMVDASQADHLRSRGIKYLILHKDLKGEVLHLGGVFGPEIPSDIAAHDRSWRKEFGAPVYEDRWLRVFLVNANAEYLGPYKRRM